MKPPFCYLEIHNWKYRKEKHEVSNHPRNIQTIRVIVRECKWCGKREHLLLPRENGGNNWKTCLFNEESKVDYETLLKKQICKH